MIKSFAHKGLERFLGMMTKEVFKQNTKQSLILFLLDSAESALELDFPGANLHQLKGKEKEIWSVKVNGNWRVTFRFKDGDAYIVDYCDYH